MFNPVAPHGTGGGPPEPAPGDAGTFDGIQSWRPPSYNERQMGDKPAHAQGWDVWDRTERRRGDHARQRQLESLLGVDRSVASLVEALRSRGTLNDALIIFTSDNGYGWGEHRWGGKEVPYEESIRVPLIIRHDPLTSGEVDTEHLVLNLDLAPTIADIAGVPAPGVHGQSLGPILQGRTSEWRSDFLIEHVSSKTSIPTYCAVRSETEVVIRYDTDEWEYYDLDRDPWQLRSSLPPAELRDRLRELCEPGPPGMG
jgi:N-acetylglucosamine-6-sulfatase